jgi:hypothetical protein
LFFLSLLLSTGEALFVRVSTGGDDILRQNFLCSYFALMKVSAEKSSIGLIKPLGRLHSYTLFAFSFPSPEMLCENTN